MSSRSIQKIFGQFAICTELRESERTNDDENLEKRLEILV